jgi:zinc-ribbon domain
VFCINCGKPYEPSHKFCNYCGYPVPQSGEPQEDDRAAEPIVAAATPEAIAEVPGSRGPELPTVTSAPMPAVECAPYARFVSLVLAFVLLISVLAFNIAEAFVRNRWENTILSVVVLLGASLLARSANAAWRRVGAAEPEADVTLKRRHRRVLRNSVIISLLFLASAAVVSFRPPSAVPHFSLPQQRWRL